MTTKQENKLSMYFALRDFLIPNDPLTKDLPNFTANFTVLQDTINKIQAFGEMQRSDKTGIAKQKNQIKDAMIKIAADHSRKIAALAKFTGNTALLSEVNFSASDFTRVTDVALKDFVQIIYDKAQANIDSLTPYGITPETQKNLLDFIVAYNASIAKPRVGITVKTQATKELVVLFDTADTVVENMDFAVEIIRLTQTSFYNGYKTVRKLVDTSSGSLSLKAIAKELVSGVPVKGAMFRFIREGLKSSTGGNDDILKKTAEKGSFNIKIMPAGNYQVVVSKPGFREKTVNVSVADGEMTQLQVELEKG